MRNKSAPVAATTEDLQLEGFQDGEVAHDMIIDARRIGQRCKVKKIHSNKICRIEIEKLGCKDIRACTYADKPRTRRLETS